MSEQHYNKLSAKGRRHESLAGIWDAYDEPVNRDASNPETIKPGWHQSNGDWFVDENEGCVWIIIPGSGPEPFYFKRRPEQACWQYNGNPDSPTLSPSLHCIGRWHGWFQNGALRSC